MLMFVNDVSRLGEVTEIGSAVADYVEHWTDARIAETPKTLGDASCCSSGQPDLQVGFERSNINRAARISNPAAGSV